MKRGRRKKKESGIIKLEHDIERKVKYPKFILFAITVVIAILLFQGREIPFVQDALMAMGILGIFFAGMLFTYGFTSAPAAALLLALAPNFNPFVGAIIGGAGALLSDSLIFLFIRSSFRDEIDKLEKEHIIQHIEHHIPSRIKRLLLPILAGFILASPLPNEIGVSMLAAYRALSKRLFALISYTTNTVGIFVILLIGQAIA